MIFCRNIQKTRIEFLFQFSCGLLVITLSSLKLFTKNNMCMLCASVSCCARLFLQHLIRTSFCEYYLKLMIDGSPPHVKFLSDYLVALRFVFLTQQQQLNCVDIIISTRTASAADCSKHHQQPVDACFV